MLNKELLVKHISKFKLGYFKESLYQIITNSAGQLVLTEASSDFSPFITILHRSHYHESLQQYPVNNRRELKKLLRLERTVKQQGKFNSYKITHMADGVSWVNRWYSHDSLHIPGMFVFAESLLLSSSLKVNQLLDCKPSKNTHSDSLFVGRNVNGITSSLSSAIITNIETFSVAGGFAIPQDKDVFDLVDSDEFYRLLVSGVLSLSPEDWINSQQPLDKGLLKQYLFPSALSTALIISIYLAASSAFLGYKATSLTGLYEGYSADVNAALSVQHQVNKLKEQLKAQHEFITSRKHFSSIWSVLIPVFQEASLSNISYENERFIISGTTDSASTLLSNLVSIAGVADAKFDGQTRKNRDQDQFVISFKLAAQGDR